MPWTVLFYCYCTTAPVGSFGARNWLMIIEKKKLQILTGAVTEVFIL